MLLAKKPKAGRPRKLAPGPDYVPGDEQETFNSDKKFNLIEILSKEISDEDHKNGLGDMRHHKLLDVYERLWERFYGRIACWCAFFSRVGSLLVDYSSKDLIFLRLIANGGVKGGKQFVRMLIDECCRDCGWEMEMDLVHFIRRLEGISRCKIVLISAFSQEVVDGGSKDDRDYSTSRTAVVFCHRVEDGVTVDFGGMDIARREILEHFPKTRTVSENLKRLHGRKFKEMMDGRSYVHTAKVYYDQINLDRETPRRYHTIRRD